MRVGFSGDVVADGRIEGHMEGVQLEVMLFSNVFLKFTVLGKCIFVTFTFIWFIKVSLARKLFSTLVAIAESACTLFIWFPRFHLQGNYFSTLVASASNCQIIFL